MLYYQMLPNNETQRELGSSYGKLIFWVITGILLVLILIKIFSPFIVEYFVTKTI
jgi:hypothetical protein